VFNLAAIFIFLYGFMQVMAGNFAGMIFSLILGAVGIFTFGIHTYFLSRGRPEFKTAMSISILIATLAVSTAEIIFTLLLI
jgi:hypothetical protein